MPGVWKELSVIIREKISENWVNAAFFFTPLIGTYAYVQNYKEKEKLAHKH